MGFWETSWGKMSVMNVGSFQVFIKRMTLIGVLHARQSQCFPENLDFHFLCLNNIFLFGGQICEAFVFRI